VFSPRLFMKEVASLHKRDEKSIFALVGSSIVSKLNLRLVKSKFFLSGIGIFVSFVSMPLIAGESPCPEGRLSEDKQIAFLVQASEQTVQQLKEVQTALTAFRKQEASCIASPDDAEGLYTLSKCALRVLKGIRATHIESYFRPAFIEELEKISKTAASKSIPPVGAL
jgi:hypothetical protein